MPQSPHSMNNPLVSASDLESPGIDGERVKKERHPKGSEQSLNPTTSRGPPPPSPSPQNYTRPNDNAAPDPVSAHISYGYTSKLVTTDELASTKFADEPKVVTAEQDHSQINVGSSLFPSEEAYTYNDFYERPSGVSNEHGDCGLAQSSTLGDIAPLEPTTSASIASPKLSDAAHSSTSPSPVISGISLAIMKAQKQQAKARSPQVVSHTLMEETTATASSTKQFEIAKIRRRSDFNTEDFMPIEVIDVVMDDVEGCLDPSISDLTEHQWLADTSSSSGHLEPIPLDVHKNSFSITISGGVASKGELLEYSSFSDALISPSTPLQPPARGSKLQWTVLKPEVPDYVLYSLPQEQLNDLMAFIGNACNDFPFLEKYDARHLFLIWNMGQGKISQATKDWCSSEEGKGFLALTKANIRISQPPQRLILLMAAVCSHQYIICDGWFAGATETSLPHLKHFHLFLNDKADTSGSLERMIVMLAYVLDADQLNAEFLGFIMSTMTIPPMVFDQGDSISEIYWQRRTHNIDPGSDVAYKHAGELGIIDLYAQAAFFHDGTRVPLHPLPEIVASLISEAELRGIEEAEPRGIAEADPMDFSREALTLRLKALKARVDWSRQISTLGGKYDKVYEKIHGAMKRLYQHKEYRILGFHPGPPLSLTKIVIAGAQMVGCLSYRFERYCPSDLTLNAIYEQLEFYCVQAERSTASP